MDNVSSTSKRKHKHRHHHHHHHHQQQHHNDKYRQYHHHHHHRHHNRQHRAKSAESIRNRAQQKFSSPSKFIMSNPSYVDHDQQPVIVYREAPNGESYTVDNNTQAAVPYVTDNETTFVDDQQTPMFVYRDGQMCQPSIVTDASSQQFFYHQHPDHAAVSNSLH
jgi:hypothetical protein